MRILVYGMQSSGASLVTYFLAQKPNTLAIIDLWNNYEAPCLEDVHASDIILKCVVTTKVTLETHILNFNPDKKVLVLRHPYFNYVSLKNKPWSNESGRMEEKFKVLETVLNKRDQFDLVIMYEDFLFDRRKVLKEIQSIGYKSTKDYFKFNRSKGEILNYNLRHSEWCNEFYQSKWGFGQIVFQKTGHMMLKAFRYISLKEKTRVRNLCPSLCGYYKNTFHWDSHKIFIYILSLISQAIQAIKPYFRHYSSKFKYYI